MEIFPQGSYANNTNSSISYDDYKSLILKALKAKFGNNAVKVKNNCINITENSYHVNADIVPAFQYRDYKIIKSVNTEKYIEGIKFFAQFVKYLIAFQ